MSTENEPKLPWSPWKGCEGYHFLQLIHGMNKILRSLGFSPGEILVVQALVSWIKPEDGTQVSVAQSQLLDGVRNYQTVSSSLLKMKDNGMEVLRVGMDLPGKPHVSSLYELSGFFAKIVEKNGELKCLI